MRCESAKPTTPALGATARRHTRLTRGEQPKAGANTQRVQSRFNPQRMHVSTRNGSSNVVTSAHSCSRSSQRLIVRPGRRRGGCLRGAWA